MTRILWISEGRYLLFGNGSRKDNTLLESLGLISAADFFEYLEEDDGTWHASWKKRNGMTLGVKYLKEDFEVVDD